MPHDHGFDLVLKRTVQVLAACGALAALLAWSGDKLQFPKRLTEVELKTDSQEKKLEDLREIVREYRSGTELKIQSVEQKVENVGENVKDVKGMMNTLLRARLTREEKNNGQF